jgi:hypothetical protein
MGWTRLETCIRLAAHFLGGASKDAVCAEGEPRRDFPLGRSAAASRALLLQLVAGLEQKLDLGPLLGAT